MSSEVIIDPEAQQEFDEAYDFYESQTDGLGERFADTIEATLNSLVMNPRMHQVIYESVRRSVVKSFPYNIYYREEEFGIRVIAIFHAKRDPSIWQSRIHE